MPAGRPSKLTPELAAFLCGRISRGESLRRICEDDDMPNRSTVMDWVIRHKDFADQYARAREAQADFYAEEIIELADKCRIGQKTITKGESVEVHEGDMVERTRLQIDARKWYASKVAPKKYGDRIEHTGPDGGPIVFTVQRVGK